MSQPRLIAAVVGEGILMCEGAPEGVERQDVVVGKPRREQRQRLHERGPVRRFPLWSECRFEAPADLIEQHEISQRAQPIPRPGLVLDLAGVQVATRCLPGVAHDRRERREPTQMPIGWCAHRQERGEPFGLVFTVETHGMEVGRSGGRAPLRRAGGAPFRESAGRARTPDGRR
jgi:hypothetical protein